MPAWQTTYLSGSPLLALNNGMRAIPDVSALADGEHNAFGVYQNIRWQLAGGTRHDRGLLPHHLGLQQPDHLASQSV
jgi:hypothetical protein